MTRPIITIAALFATGCGGALGIDAPELSSISPTPIPSVTADRHLIYLHGKIIEDQGRRPIHPRFGIYEYQEILDAFTAAGFQVHSDQRPAGSQPPVSADLTASQVRDLLHSGVPAQDITVVGFSKGGAIAVLTALELAEPELNFVFIACCGPWIDDVLDSPDQQIRGHLLSIFEASDTTGSCSALFGYASPDSVTAEIELHIGGGHGAFYRPHPEWLEPVVRWARHEDPQPLQTANP